MIINRQIVELILNIPKTNIMQFQYKIKRLDSSFSVDGHLSLLNSAQFLELRN